MSVAFAPSSLTRGSSRWLLLVSLALNLFFVGVVVAIVIRTPAPSTWDHNVFVRVERLAASLSSADAAILCQGMQTHHDAIETAQDQYHAAREEIRETLRQDLFKVENMRAAMVKTRAARQAYDQIIQNVFAEVAPQLTSAGRHALADWRSRRKSTGNRQ